jgi:hypothetical protein
VKQILKPCAYKRSEAAAGFGPLSADGVPFAL